MKFYQAVELINKLNIIIKLLVKFKYQNNTLLAFASFPFYKTIAFYFYLFMTGGYAYFVYWDHVFYTRLAAEKEAKEALEKQLKEEEEKLKEKEQEQILKQEDINNKENQDGIQVEQFDTQNDENQSKAILGQQDFNDVQINQEIGGTIFNKDKEPKLTQIEDNIVREQVQFKHDFLRVLLLEITLCNNSLFFLNDLFQQKSYLGDLFFINSSKRL